ncbi:hypothetical protein [Chryseobacterium indologenes]|uniref:hypothetical protein n=1 Tax=Chryseobacterium indologenes TaxID=253 RepID=UPI0011AB80FA|nr:hypothetical protein [Chryseobacterium indologenes]
MSVSPQLAPQLLLESRPSLESFILKNQSAFEGEQEIRRSAILLPEGDSNVYISENSGTSDAKRSPANESLSD